MQEFRGSVERINGSVVEGWVLPSNFECSPADITIRVVVDEVLVGIGSPAGFRPDLGSKCGFRIECDIPLNPEHFLVGQIRVVASHEFCVKEITLTQKTRAELLAQFVGSRMKDFRGPEIRIVKSALDGLPRAKEAGVEGPEKISILQTLKSIQPSTSGPRQSTTVPVELGFVSPDGSALLGRDGEAFLVLGSNRLLDQFLLAPEDAGVQRLARAWVDLILARKGALESAGTRFLQMIIPEKISLYPERFPGRITAPSALVQVLENTLCASPVEAHYLSGYRELLRAKPGGDLFLRLDTHLSVYGAYTLLGACLARLGLALPFPLDQSSEKENVGDLATRFFGIPLYETFNVPSQSFVDAISGAMHLVSKDDDGTKHIGVKYVWRNETAPFNMKVVAFANSFFERAGTARSLSWWFCRVFREFHFVWSPDLDMNYVRREQPDLVICQTIERFLGRLPADIV